MEKYEVGSRYKYYYKYSKSKVKRIEVDDNILKYMMSKIIFKNTPDNLSYLLNSIDEAIRYLFKYVDRLKHFKNYLRYNR